MGVYNCQYENRSDNELAHGAFNGYRCSKYIGVEVEYLAFTEASEGVTFECNVAIASLPPSRSLDERWEFYTVG